VLGIIQNAADAMRLPQLLLPNRHFHIIIYYFPPSPAITITITNNITTIKGFGGGSGGA